MAQYNSVIYIHFCEWTLLLQAKIYAEQIYKAFTFNYFKYFETFLVDQ